MATMQLIEKKGLEGVLGNAGNGAASGTMTTLNLMAYTAAAGLAGYVLGDLAPEAINYVRSSAGVPETVLGISTILPRGFGIPNALAVPEQILLGHDYAREIGMGYLAAAPVVAKYFGEHIVAPVIKPFVELVRR